MPVLTAMITDDDPFLSVPHRGHSILSYGFAEDPVAN
jgi:hypothetical protein